MLRKTLHEELHNERSALFSWKDRHKRLVARLLLAFGSSILVFVIGTVAMWFLEHGQQGSEIDGLGDAAFFSAVQLLTISSQLKNPVTPVGKVVDVVLEMWAIFVVTAVAGSFASFFSSSDTDTRDEE